jgi:hypothetical protein
MAVLTISYVTELTDDRNNVSFQETRVTIYAVFTPSGCQSELFLQRRHAARPRRIAFIRSGLSLVRVSSGRSRHSWFTVATKAEVNLVIERPHHGFHQAGQNGVAYGVGIAGIRDVAKPPCPVVPKVLSFQHDITIILSADTLEETVERAERGVATGKCLDRTEMIVIVCAEVETFMDHVRFRKNFVHGYRWWQ